MKALIVDYGATANDQLYVGAVFLDNTGTPTDEQNLPLGNFTITGLGDIATAAQTAILTYSTSMGYGLTGSDILNPASAAVGIT